MLEFTLSTKPADQEVGNQMDVYVLTYVLSLSDSHKQQMAAMFRYAHLRTSRHGKIAQRIGA